MAAENGEAVVQRGEIMKPSRASRIAGGEQPCPGQTTIALMRQRHHAQIAGPPTLFPPGMAVKMFIGLPSAP